MSSLTTNSVLSSAKPVKYVVFNLRNMSHIEQKWPKNRVLRYQEFEKPSKDEPKALLLSVAPFQISSISNKQS